MTGVMWAVFAVVLCLAFLTLSRQNRSEALLGDALRKQRIPLLDSASEQRVFQALLEPFVQHGAEVEEGDGSGARTIHFRGDERHEGLVIEFEHAPAFTMSASGRYMIHHVLFTYRFTSRHSLPQGVSLTTSKQTQLVSVQDRSAQRLAPEHAESPRHELEWRDDVLAPGEHIVSPFPEGLSPCVGEGVDFEVDFERLSREQRGLVSTLVSMAREGNVLECVYAGSIHGLLDDSQLAHITREQLGHALTLLGACEGWADGASLQDRVLAQLLEINPVLPAQIRSAAARLLLGLYAYPLMGDDAQAEALRARLRDEHLDWDYTQFAQGLPAEFLDTCRVEQIEDMARESGAPLVWAELERRVGLGAMLDDGELPFSARIAWLDHRLSGHDFELEPLAAWIGTPLIDEVYFHVVQRLLAHGTHPLWQDSRIQRALSTSIASMTHAEQDRLLRTLLSTPDTRHRAHVTAQLSGLIEELHVEQPGGVSLSWLLYLMDLEAFVRVDLDAIIAHLEARPDYDAREVFGAHDLDASTILYFLFAAIQSGTLRDHAITSEPVRLLALDRLRPLLERPVLDEEHRAIRDTVIAELLQGTPTLTNQKEEARAVRSAIRAYTAQIEREGVTPTAIAALHAIAERAHRTLRPQLKLKLSGWIGQLEDDPLAGSLTHVEHAGLQGALSAEES